jgi:hypothetical protein
MADDKTAPTLSLNPRPDGYGYLYGTLVTEEGRFRVDIMPPRPHWRGDVMLDDCRPHPTDWVVFVDGEEIARVAQIDNLAATIAPKLIGKR